MTSTNNQTSNGYDAADAADAAAAAAEKIKFGLNWNCSRIYYLLYRWKEKNDDAKPESTVDRWHWLIEGH